MAKLSKLGGTLFTQISSGIYRGKKLALPALSSTRSTKSIVKGSFFDTWRAKLRGAAFIECFGGSGAMALEALSNGAKNVYAIEKDAAAHKIMRKNFELFGLGANAILGDCFERLPEILHELQADINGRSGTNSLNLNGRNLDKNRTAACCENLDDKKDSCRKNFNDIKRGEDRYCSAQSSDVVCKSERCGADSKVATRGDLQNSALDETQSCTQNGAKDGARNNVQDSAQNGAQNGVPDFGLSGGENFNDAPEKQSAAGEILSSLNGDRGVVSYACRGLSADTGFCVDCSLNENASDAGSNTYSDEEFKDSARRIVIVDSNLKSGMQIIVPSEIKGDIKSSENNDMLCAVASSKDNERGDLENSALGGAEGDTQNSAKDLAEWGTRSCVPGGVRNDEQSDTDIGCMGASRIKYRVNSLVTDAASFSEKFDASSASQYDASDAETANRSVNLSSKCSESSNFDANRGAGLGVSCEEKEILNLGENFNASYGENLHSNANFVYDSRKNSTVNSSGDFAASCKENSRPNVNLTYDSRKIFTANCNENFVHDLDESSTANSRENFSCGLGESSAANSSESRTVNSGENFVSDLARRVFVYLDPPFAIRQGFGEIYERVLALIARLGSAQCELLIAIEHMSELELPPKIGDFALLKSRKFGATTMSYYAK